MSISPRRAACIALCGMLLFTGVGCALFAPTDIRSPPCERGDTGGGGSHRGSQATPPNPPFARGGTAFNDAGAADDEEVQRQRFQINRDPDAMRWLLGHRIEQGMTVAEVSRVFGEEGVREYNDRWLKTGGGFYRREDVVYRWGPDSDGQSVYLVFRDGQLTDFEPSNYR